MQKLHFTEVLHGSIVMRVEVHESGPGWQLLKSYQGFVDADEIDEVEFVQTLWNQLKCSGDISVMLTRGVHEGTLIVHASCDETGVDIHEVNFAGGACPDFSIGEYAQSLRAQE